MPPLKGSGLRDPETLNWWLNRVTLHLLFQFASSSCLSSANTTTF